MTKSVKRAFSAPDLNSKRPKQTLNTVSQPSNTLLNYFQTSKPIKDDDEAKKSLKKQISLTEYFKFESKSTEIITSSNGIKSDHLPIIIDDEDEIDKALVKAEIKTQEVIKTRVNAFDLLLKKKEPLVKEEETEWGEEVTEESTGTTKVFRKCPFYKRIEGLLI